VQYDAWIVKGVITSPGFVSISKLMVSCIAAHSTAIDTRTNLVETVEFDFQHSRQCLLEECVQLDACVVASFEEAVV
jgi:hypothetical protein